MIGTLLNVVAFQCCWFAGVLGAANGMPWLGLLATTAWIGVHLVVLGVEAGLEARVLIAAALLGWLADSTLVLTGLIGFPEYARLGGPSPLWMMALWVGFAATLRHALGWLRERWMLGALLGAVGGPLAYLGGQALGAIPLSGHVALIAVAAQYAVVTPVLLAVIYRLERGRSLQTGRPTTDPQP